MKTARIIGVITFMGIMFFAYTTVTLAQHLMEDVVWFKMKGSVKGASA